VTHWYYEQSPLSAQISIQKSGTFCLSISKSHPGSWTYFVTHIEPENQGYVWFLCTHMHYCSIPHSVSLHCTCPSSQMFT